MGLRTPGRVTTLALSVRVAQRAGNIPRIGSLVPFVEPARRLRALGLSRLHGPAG